MSVNSTLSCLFSHNHNDIDNLMLFILIMFLCSFVSYIENGDEDGIDTSTSSDTNGMVVAKALAIILAFWLLLKIVFRFIGPSSDDEYEENSEFYTLHFDGSDINQLQKGGAGCIIRDQQGDLVIAASYNLDFLYPDCHVAIAEAMGLRNGLRLAKRNNIKLGLVQGDSQDVVNRVLDRVKRKASVSILLSKIILEIRNDLFEQSIDSECRVELVGREGNRVADRLAFLGCGLDRSSRTFTRDQSLPSMVAQLVEQDKLDWDLLVN